MRPSKLLIQREPAVMSTRVLARSPPSPVPERESVWRTFTDASVFILNHDGRSEKRFVTVNLFSITHTFCCSHNG